VFLFTCDAVLFIGVVPCCSVGEPVRLEAHVHRREVFRQINKIHFGDFLFNYTLLHALRCYRFSLRFPTDGPGRGRATDDGDGPGQRRLGPDRAEPNERVRVLGHVVHHGAVGVVGEGALRLFPYAFGRSRRKGK